MGILDNIAPASKTVESINALVYGDSGVGKTYFAGSGSEKGKNDLLIAIEHGTVSAANAGSEVNVLKINTWDEFMEAIEAIVDNPHRFGWVIVDSLTKLQDLIWKDILDTAVGKNPARSPYKRELQEYGEAQLRFRSVIERLNSSDANVLYTALSVLATDEESNEFKMPSIHGQKGDLAAWTCAQMDIVGNIRVLRKDGQLFRAFTFSKSPEIFAKDRFGVFTKSVKNLSLAKFTDTLLEAGKTDNADKANPTKKEQ